VLTEFAPKVIVDRESFLRKNNIELETLQQQLQDMLDNEARPESVDAMRGKVAQYTTFLQQVKPTENLFDLYEVNIILTNY
jgi:hypothetical protein